MIESGIIRTGFQQRNRKPREVLGLIPAAGHGSRIAPLPCSKEIYPIGLRLLDERRGSRPKAACHYLLEKMGAAGVAKTYIVLRDGKWDIPAYLADGWMFQMHLAYLMIRGSLGAPYTLDQAYPFVRDALVTFGFPDILFNGDDAFQRLLSQQAADPADILLGLFPADRPEQMDMVELEKDGRVTEIVIQPRHTKLQYSWDIAVWTPVFSEFLHAYLADQPASSAVPHRAELSVGDVVRAAIAAGLVVKGLPVSDEPYLDIGRPEGLTQALERFANAW